MLRRGWSAAVLAVLLAAIVVAGCGGGNSSGGGGGGASAGGSKATPIRIGFSTWNGYIGLVIGVKEHLFEKAGVKVSYTVVEDPVQRFNALKAGSLDAIATTPDTSTFRMSFSTNPPDRITEGMRRLAKSFVVSSSSGGGGAP